MAVEKKVEDLLVGDTIELHGVQWRVFFKKYLSNHTDCQIKLHGAPLQDIGIEERPELNVVVSRTTMWTLYEPPSVFDETRPNLPTKLVSDLKVGDRFSFSYTGRKFVLPYEQVWNVTTIKSIDQFRFALLCANDDSSSSRHYEPRGSDIVFIRLIETKSETEHNPCSEVWLSPCAMSGCANKSDLDSMFCSSCRWVSSSTTSLKVGDTFKYKNNARFPLIPVIFRVVKPEVGQGIGLRAIGVERAAYPHFIDPEVEILIPRSPSSADAVEPKTEKLPDGMVRKEVGTLEVGDRFSTGYLYRTDVGKIAVGAQVQIWTIVRIDMVGRCYVDVTDENGHTHSFNFSMSDSVYVYAPVAAPAPKPEFAWAAVQASALEVGDTFKYKDGGEYNKGLVFTVKSAGVAMLAFDVVDQHGKVREHKMNPIFEVLANRPVAPESKDENALATREHVVAEIQDAAEKLASVFESTWGSMTISQRDARYIANAVLSKADLRLKKIK